MSRGGCVGCVVLLLACAVARAQLSVRISVVEPDRSTALLVAAGARAGVRAAAARRAEDGALREELNGGLGGERGERGEEDDIEISVEVMPSEPGELLDAPAQVCAAAGQQDPPTYAVVTGVGGGVVLSAGAAARAGVPLLLVGAVAEARAQWEALALHPRAELAASAARDLMREKGWQHAALLHADSASVAADLAPDPDQLNLLVRQIPPENEDAMLRDLMLVLKKAGYVNFVVWGSAAECVRVLDAAQRAGLLSTRHSYLLLSFELHTQDLEPLSHGGANITGLMFFDKSAEGTINATEAALEEYRGLLDEYRRELEGGEGAAGAEDALDELTAEQERIDGLSAANVPSALLLSFDAALLLSGALHALRLRAPPDDAPPPDCSAGVAAFDADTLLNYMRSEEGDGATGRLSWEADGWRRNVILQVVELDRGGELLGEGTWSERAGVEWHRRPRPAPPLPPESMANRTFEVRIATNPPYVMGKESETRLTGNARFEGFCIELIERLATVLHFNYTFVLQERNAYGSLNKTTHEWEGMLRNVMDDDQNLTLAITDLTITEEREQAVDFTTPFMNLGIAILFRRPDLPEPDFFAFLLPFSRGVWVALGFAYLFSSLVLYCVGRLCPEEWQNPYPCIEEPDALENQFTLGNALWFNLGAMLLQGSEIAPVGYSTRAVASVWWLFALVITSSYTANLATLLAKKSSTELIKNVNDLADNDQGITYGAKRLGSTMTFFQNSESEPFKTMYKNMQKWPQIEQNEDGINKVMKEKFAFLMESTSIEYTVERNCEVYMVGDLLDSKGYGIAIRKGSPYRQELNLALLRLQEAGVLREMKRLWWEERNGGGACKETEDHENTELEMNSFYGLFLVLVVGCVLGLVMSCSDLALSTWRHPRHPHLPFSKNLAEELRFVFQFQRSAKPVTGPLIVEKTPSERTSELEETEAETDGAALAESEGEGAAEGADGEGEAAEGEGARCTSAQSHGPRRRRRSSMHTASMRLARHAQHRDSNGTPARHAR